MTTTDWIINISLVLIVLRQLQEHRIGRHFVVLPLALVGLSAALYLRAVPTAGNDLILVGTLVALGAALGVAGAFTSKMRSDGRSAFVQAGFWAAVLWVAGMGARIGFYLWSENGGAPAIAHFSASHDITSSDAWVAAFVLMALTEVTVRIGLIVLRGHLLTHDAAAAERSVELPAPVVA